MCRAVLRESPGHRQALCCLGSIASRRGQFATAISHFRAALALDPTDASVHEHVANALFGLGQPGEALASYDRVLALKPDLADTHFRRANALRALKRLEEAVAGYERALALRPNYAEALNNRGNALCLLRHQAEALASYDRALAIRPDYVQALNNRGNALRDLRRLEEALASYDRALVIDPKFVPALNNRGNVLLDLQRPQDALASYDLALAISPANIESLNHRGAALHMLKEDEEAIRTYEQLLKVRPDFDYVRGKILGLKLLCCDWRDYDRSVGLVARDVALGKRSAYPLIFLSVSDAADEQLKCAKIYCTTGGSPWRPPQHRARRRSDKIRVAYVSADYRDHPVADLTAGLFEAHDKARFETTAISLGPAVKDPMRQRLECAFDRFIDVQQTSDADTGLLLKELEIDIAVDLMGHTLGARTEIFAARPVPIQVNFLGYPGTMGTNYIDYIFADRFVIPEHQHSFYTEKVVYLPDSFQPNDSRRRIAELTPRRAEAGLPETGFVFCSFNGNHKINPPVFDVWMRLLRRVEGSLLWLRADKPVAVANLRREAEARGVAGERLVFAERTEKPAMHLARYRLADLFLDTLPYNAHATASDALWAGLPIVTCLGSAFSGRVAGSLLNAVGLPELVTFDLEAYEALAFELARDGDRLAAIKAKLARNRETYPLFDTDRFRRHIESAYRTMWERHLRGEPPASFAVIPDP